MQTFNIFLCLHCLLLIVGVTPVERYIRHAINGSEYCMPEEFDHFYIKNENEVERVKNFWNTTRINESATLVKICLKSNGLPLTRKCLSSRSSGAMWEPMSRSTMVRCFKTPQERIITEDLSVLHNELRQERIPLHNVSDCHHVTHRLITILEKPKSKFVPADVFYTNRILEDVLEGQNFDVQLSQDVVCICRNFMSMEAHVLRKSAELNSTNNFLAIFENFGDKVGQKYVPSSLCGSTEPLGISPEFRGVSVRNHSNVGVFLHATVNISIFYINPKCANISGIVIYDHQKTSPTSSSKTRHKLDRYFDYSFMYTNESTSELLMDPSVQVAAYLPENIWNYVQSSRPQIDPYIVLKVYGHDSLFVTSGNTKSCKPSSKILSISIPSFTDYLPHPLPFLVRNEDYKPNSNNSLPSGTGCGYWSYNSAWLKDGVETNPETSHSGPVVQCTTKHLTAFSFLVGGKYRQEEKDDIALINPMQNRALDVISIVGCSLSLLGLMGIWITALLFKSWRSLSSTKVLLNMCAALTLQMILFLFVNTKEVTEELILEESFYECVVLGALLQYFILVMFTWMLIIAFLQFQRYVTVIGIERPPRYILKAALIAWSLPLLPTLIVAFVDPRGYVPSVTQVQMNNAICYPSGYGLAFGVVLPITLICIANLTIFVYVFYSISHTLNQSMNRQEKLMIANQVRLSVLLFFLLGLCWIFGIFSFLNDSVVFSYLFSLTATLQGFVFFVYFVILNEVSRRSWYDLLCSSRKHRIQSRLRDTTLTTTTSVTEGKSYTSVSNNENAPSLSPTS